MIPIRSRQLQHAGHRQILVEPLGNLGVKDRYRAAPVARFRLLLYVLTQHTGDGIAVMSGELGNLDIRPAFLLEASKWLTVPYSVASSLPPQYM